MSTSIITPWEDIIFEYRNKNYGAYLLRYTYPKCLTVSALIVIVLFLSTMVGLHVIKKETLQVKTTRKVVVIDYTQLAPPPPIEKIYVPPKTTVIVKKEVKKYEVPKVTIEEVKEEEEMPTIEEVKEILDAVESDIQGIGEDEVVVVPPPRPEPEPIFIGTPPTFPGGDKALEKWLDDHLKYPPAAARMGIEGLVIVEFNVDIDGRLSDIKIVRSLHRLCDNEAIRLIKSMPAWTPGELDGLKVVVRHKISIPFVLSKLYE